MAGRDLPEDMILAGRAVLAATDALAMQAQGAMWIYDHVLDDWRYYLVTSLVDSLGRRKTYKLLLEAFEKANLPEAMTVEDVHLGSPAEPLFQIISAAVHINDGIGRVNNCMFDGVVFDGVIYRSVRDTPTPQEARKIEKVFAKRVRDLVASDR